MVASSSCLLSLSSFQSCPHSLGLVLDCAGEGNSVLRNAPIAQIISVPERLEVPCLPHFKNSFWSVRASRGRNPCSTHCVRQALLNFDELDRRAVPDSKEADEQPLQNVKSAARRNKYNVSKQTGYHSRKKQREWLNVVSLRGLGLMDIASLLEKDISLQEGKRMHSYFVEMGMDESTLVGNLLVNMYRKRKTVEDAHKAFDQIQKPNVVSWTSIISAYAQQGRSKEALQLYQRMQLERVEASKDTFTTVLGACASCGALADGKTIHPQVVEHGYELDCSVGNALVNMYGKGGAIEEARILFEKMFKRNVVSWTAMISAYVQHDHSKDGLQLFGVMQQQGVQANKITFVSLLGACASLRALPEGEMIHKCIADAGFLADAVVGTALINMYGKCGALKNAYDLFVQMQQRDVVCWNAMITVYVQHGQGRRALELFEEMQQDGIEPNKSTYVNILGACASVGALSEGRAIHASIVECGLIFDVVVETALLNMYGKCGVLEEAYAMFQKMHQHNMVSWNSLIALHAHYGLDKAVFSLLSQMEEEGMRPNDVTFVSLLSACSRAGLVDLGRCLFDSMIDDYGITPGLEHYSCMIDLLARAAELEEAEQLIYRMPFQWNACVWRSLLGGCRLYGDVERGERAAKHLFDLDPQNSGSFILLSNMYAEDGRLNQHRKGEASHSGASSSLRAVCT